MIDKILVFGDSIAYGEWDSEGGWVARLRKHIDVKYNIGKDGNIQVSNLGIPGDVVARIAERCENELKMRVNENEKCLVLLAIGLNDSSPNNNRTGKQTDPEKFKESLSSMIKTAQAYNCEVACIGLTPANPARSKGLILDNQDIKRYDSYISEVCAENGVPKSELFNELLALNFPEMLMDAAHPNDEGHALLYEKIKAFLVSQGYLN